VSYLYFMVFGLAFSIFFAWLYFFYYMMKSLKQSPRLESYDREDGLRNKNSFDDLMPKVSIIVPARNEEMYLSKCLDSLLNQNYPNFEIIVINDSSSDGTWDIIQRYTENYEQSLEAINASPSPDGWIGKSWACYQGYLKATGDIFMFTDADTIHSQNALSLAIGHLINQQLDALTAIPRLVCEDFWTKITLPVVWSISYVRYSPLRANNPDTTTGYFFGSFYVISRRVYEAVGTHEAVKGEIVEDGALGGIVKKEKFRLKVVRGEHHILAIWARDLSSLWQGLRRLMIPLYYQDKIHASIVTISVFLLLLTPYFLLSFSISYLAQLIMIGNHTSINNFGIWDAVLIGFSLMAIGLVILSAAIQSKHVLYNSPMYSLGAPIASFIISLGFISSIIDAKSGIVKWKGRKYAIGNTTQHPLR
jgi:glycosyltransferase involved in cell wall biosynthesis